MLPHTQQQRLSRRITAFALLLMAIVAVFVFGWPAIRDSMATMNASGAERAQLAAVRAGLQAYRERWHHYPASLAELSQQGSLPEQYLSPVGAYGHFRYCYVAGIIQPDPAGWPVVFSPDGALARGARSVLFVSGDIRILSQSEFAALWSDFCKEHVAVRGQSPRIQTTEGENQHPFGTDNAP